MRYYRGSWLPGHPVLLEGILPSPCLEKINVTGTRYVLDMSKLLGIKRFIFSSSLAACKFPSHNNVLTEKSPIDADFPYAQGTLGTSINK